MNCLLVVLDCLRKDYFDTQMPHVQEMTQDWFRFENHWGVAHCSDPNHSALFTGLGPWTTDITTQMGVLYKQLLPTMFMDWKLRVKGGSWGVQPVQVPAFYWAGMNVCSWHKVNHVSDLELRAVKIMVDEVKQPWLGFIRTMDCHYPYLNLPMPPRGEGGDIVPQYTKATQHLDEFVVNLVNYVLDEFPDTIIAICADHGELLGEHGEWDHLYTLYNILTQTPFVMYVPGLEGKVSKTPTQHIDFWPTIRDLLGIQKQKADGISWAAWMQGETIGNGPTSVRRRLWFQGIGAGPAREDTDAPAIDPLGSRMLWRHRGVIAGRWKLVSDVHAGGDVKYKVSRIGDYGEEWIREGKKSGPAKKLRGWLPALPSYHAWEKPFLDAWREGEDEKVILQRLRDLGYA